MPLDMKRVTDLAESDLIDLISNGIEEGREIDYKQTLKIDTDGEKKEFLADVSSFGNARGGHLLFGVAETDGRPTAVTPLTIPNPDSARLRIESLARDGISPRLPIELAFVPVSPSGYVLVLRIARSWSGPHMVSLQSTGKFYSRNSGGKYQLDVGELRSAFTAGAQVGELIRTFRQNRLSAIVSGETPVRLPESPKIILHCVPYASTVLGASIDLRKAYQQPQFVRPMYGGAYSPTFNFDGVMNHAPHATNEGLGHAYFQLFRGGSVEIVETRLFRTTEQYGKLLPSIPFAGACIASLARIFSLFKMLEVEPPAAIMLTLLGVKGYGLGLDDPMAGFYRSRIDRDALIVPPEIAESYDPRTTAAFMRPLFDVLWNATGASECGDYDGAGQPSADLRTAIQRVMGMT